MMYTLCNICCVMMYTVGSTQTQQIYNVMYIDCYIGCDTVTQTRQIYTMMYTVVSTQTKQMYIIMCTNVYC